MQALTAKIAGRRHHEAALEARALVTLEREPSNPADAQAVAVRADGELLGYLESGLAGLLNPILARGRPVFASPASKAGYINVFVPSRRDRLAPAAGATIHLVPSSDGSRAYAVDPGKGLCSCPAGRFVLCRHKRAMGGRLRSQRSQRSQRARRSQRALANA